MFQTGKEFTNPGKSYVQLCESVSLMGLLAGAWVAHGQLHHCEVPSQAISTSLINYVQL